MAESFGGDKQGIFWLTDMPSILMASHELKSPLSLIRQLAFSLGDETLTDQQRQRAVERIILTSERSLRLTGDLTKTARLDNALFQMEPISPDQICRQVIADMSPLCRERGLDISVRRRKKFPLAIANRDLLTRIVTNFVDNALHYSDAARGVELDVKLIGRDNMVRLSVRDYGPGLSKKNLKKLFEHDTSQFNMPTRPLSSGLGMYIVASFAEAMNGRVGALSHKDGVSFYVDVQASRQLSLL